ncbi:MAG: Holliday junction branch migration protein RuvA [Bacillota bacterium]|nr:Holliday junction branch migration protein RuvA [Bacillota bacterium]
MFYSLRGKLIHMEPNIAVIECGGVGYKCITTMNTQRTLKQNTETTLYTHLSVREDSVDLFGFSTLTELNCFKMLTLVSGVGPKVGVAILSELSSEQVALAIASGDDKSLTRAPGVGKKLAQRIILELKDKLKGFGSVESFSGGEAANTAVFDAGNISKAVGALTVLGFEPGEVTPILSKMDSSMSVEELINSTLKQLGKR